MPAPLKHMTPHIWGLLTLLAFIWGGSFFFVRIAVLEIPPLTLVLARVLIAAIVLNLFLIARPTGMQHRPKLWLQFAIMGMLNNIIPFSLLFYGQQELGAGLASIINALTPIWSLLIAHVATRDERLSASKLFGVMAGFAGVGIMIGGAVFAGLHGAVLALLAVIGTTISYGFASVYGRIFSDVPPLETARGQLTTSTIFMLPIALLLDKPWLLPMPSTYALGSIILLATVCTAYAYILYFRILASAGAVNISLVTLLVPVSAIALGMVFLGEILLTRHIIGLGFIFIGLAAIDGRAITFLQNQLVRPKSN